MTARCVIVAVMCLLTTPAMSHAQEPTGQDTLALARKYTTWLYAGYADSLVAASSDAARQNFSTLDSWLSQSERLVMLAGDELEVIEETWKLRNGRCQYWRTARFDRIEDLVVIRWVLDASGRIDGVGMSPEMQAPRVDADHC